VITERLQMLRFDGNGNRDGGERAAAYNSENGRGGAYLESPGGVR